MTAAQIIFGILTIAAAAGVVCLRKPLNSALCLIATLFLVAVHFALLDAHFIAAIQVLVYAGAIMVLVIFVIMLLGPDADSMEQPAKGVNTGAAILTGAFVALLCGLLIHTTVSTPGGDSGKVVDGSTAAIGKALFTDFIYPFEVTSLLVLVAIIGAVVLGREPKRPLQSGRGLSSKQLELGEQS